MGTPAAKRLDQLLDELGLNANKFAKKLGYDRSVTIYNVLNGKTQPGYNLLHDIATHIPEVNIHWLLSGKGEMLRGNIENSSGENDIFPIVVNTENEEFINLVPIYAQAGYMQGYADPEYIGNLPLAGFSYEGTMRDFEIKGDSMEPHILEGDIVRAKFLEPNHWQQNQLHLGDLFIVVHNDDGVVLKQVVAHDVKRGLLTLHSFNTYYKDYDVEAKDIKQIWYYKNFTSKRKF